MSNVAAQQRMIVAIGHGFYQPQKLLGLPHDQYPSIGGCDLNVLLSAYSICICKMYKNWIVNDVILNRLPVIKKGEALN